jgi:hypothetical protein
MTDDLAQGFVDLRPLGLASQPLPETRLYHAERALDVAALVVMTIELLLIVKIEMQQPIPHGIFPAVFRV